MKGNIFIFLLLVTFFSSAQQRYISSAIIAFSGGAYERTIQDINTALESESMLSSDEKSKAYFYRGIAMKRLLLANSSSDLIAGVPYMNSFNDFRIAQSFGIATWVDRSEKEIGELYDGLLSQAGDAIKNAGRTENLTTKGNLLTRALNHLNAAQTIRTNPQLNQIMGELYLEFGDLYTQQGTDRGTANYRAALRYLELALRGNNDCQECVTDLIEVSEKLNDDIRKSRYLQLKRSFEE